jgi:hypothetical protein
MADPVHIDKLGRQINLGDCVVVPYHNSLMVAKVIKLTPKMVRVKKLSNKQTWHCGEYNKYPEDLAIVDGADVTAYLLKL